MSLLHSDDRFDVASLASQRLDDVRDAETLAVLVWVITTGAQRWDARPFLLSQSPVHRKALLTENAGIFLRGAVERVPVGP
jgi:hypothetical protein